MVGAWVKAGREGMGPLEALERLRAPHANPFVGIMSSSEEL